MNQILRNLEQGREHLRPDREVLLNVGNRENNDEESTDSQPAEFNLVQENTHDGDLRNDIALWKRKYEFCK